MKPLTSVTLLIGCIFYLQSLKFPNLNGLVLQLASYAAISIAAINICQSIHSKVAKED